jgi:putative tricarboxylic transport membrane protein
MSITTNDVALLDTATPERGPTVKGMEIATAVALMAVGGIAIMDSLRIGSGWSADGPQSGYFPFWLGLLLMAASLGNLVSALRATRRAKTGVAPLFATWEQLGLVAQVFVPTAVFVAVIPFAGIYVSSATLVAYFMIRFGEFRWITSLPAGAAAAIVAFVVFEIWFLVALPKGPLETYLGY